MKNDNKGWMYLSLLIEIGVNMILSIMIFMFIGLLCDKKFNLNGICTIIGIVLGVLGGFYNSYRAIVNLDKKIKM